MKRIDVLFKVKNLWHNKEQYNIILQVIINGEILYQKIHFR